MAVAVFDFDQFVALYPEFADVNPAQAQAQFNQAEALILDNSECSPIGDQSRTFLFYLIVAHALALKARGDGNMVGAITSASQGSVSVGTSGPPAYGNNSWFAQTSYGLEYLAMIARMPAVNFIYIEGPEAYTDSVYGYPWGL